VIRAAGFSPSAHDPTLFIHLSPCGHTLLLYVDDILIIGDNVERISHVKKQLGVQFQISDSGPLSYFIGIEVSHSANGYYLSQSKYI
jgi:histone deacetylase 1/2